MTGDNEWTSYADRRKRAERLFASTETAPGIPGPHIVPYFSILEEEPVPNPVTVTPSPLYVEPPKVDQQSVIEEAAGIIRGTRQTTHGKPERSFDCIASLWNTYLAALADKTGASFVPLLPYQVAEMMELLKVARGVTGDPTHRDHYVDRIGYAALAHELVSGAP